MPLMYRIMIADGDKPLVGNGANQLGVRDDPARPELPIADDGTVHRGTGGLSVSPSMERLPVHLIPKRLKSLFPGARGSNNKPWLVSWHMGEGEFVSGPVTDELDFRLDPRSPDAHGFIEPARQMFLSAYQAALGATRDSWIRDEWPSTQENT